MEGFNFSAYGTNLSSLQSFVDSDNNADKDMVNLVLKYVFYIIAILLSSVGNLCIIIVVLRTKVLRTRFNYYIVNLACTDFLVPVFCMWVHLVCSINDDWVLGPFFCKAHTFIQVTVVCSSILTLTTVTLDRFLAVMFPASLCVTQTFQIAVIIGLWLSSAGISFPWLLYQRYTDFYWILGHEVICDTNFPTTTERQTYFLVFFILFYLVPLFAMFTMLIVTIVKYDKNSTVRGTPVAAVNEIRQQAVYMLLTVLVVFCVCWTPQQSLLLWDVFRDRHKKPAGVKQLKYLALYLAYASSAINPLIYVGYNKCFRHVVKEMFQRRCKGGNSQDSVSPHPVLDDSLYTITDTTEIARDEELEPSTSHQYDSNLPNHQLDVETTEACRNDYTAQPETDSAVDGIVSLHDMRHTSSTDLHGGQRNITTELCDIQPTDSTDITDRTHTIAIELQDRTLKVSQQESTPTNATELHDCLDIDQESINSHSEVEMEKCHHPSQ